MPLTSRSFCFRSSRLLAGLSHGERALLADDFAIQSSYSTACLHACKVVWRCILTCEQIEAEPQRESEDSARRPAAPRNQPAGFPSDVNLRLGLMTSYRAVPRACHPWPVESLVQMADGCLVGMRRSWYLRAARAVMSVHAWLEPE